MASIPADSKAFIKPFEGTDVTCLLVDVVMWFGADEINSILCLNLCSSLKNLPHSQKALWKQLEPQVNSEKQFISGLGVRLLIARSLDVDVPPHHGGCGHHHSGSCGPHNNVCGLYSAPHFQSYYNNTPIDVPCTSSSYCPPMPKFELNPCLHKLGNIFIDEAIYDSRAYPELEEINCKINRIYDIVFERNNTVPPVQ